MQSASELIDAFCDQLWLQDGLAAASLASYRRDLTAWAAWLEAHSKKPLLAAERTDVESFLAAQFRDNARATSISRRLSSLRRFYRLQMMLGVLAADPTLRIKSPKRPMPGPRSGCAIVRCWRRSMRRGFASPSWWGSSEHRSALTPVSFAFWARAGRSG